MNYRIYLLLFIALYAYHNAFASDTRANWPELRQIGAQRFDFYAPITKQIFDLYKLVMHRHVYLNRHDVYQIALELKKIVETMEAFEDSIPLIALRIRTEELIKFLTTDAKLEGLKPIEWNLIKKAFEYAWQCRKDAAKERNIGRGSWVTLRTSC